MFLDKSININSNFINNDFQNNSSMTHKRQRYLFIFFYSYNFIAKVGRIQLLIFAIDKNSYVIDRSYRMKNETREVDK